MLRFNDLSIGYPGLALCGGLSFEIPAGESVLLCGPNGCGKSTLLSTIAGLVPPLSGSVEGPKTLLVPSRVPKVRGFSLYQFISTALYSTSDWLCRISPDEDSSIRRAMETLGIASLADRDIASLSDGEFQKACIATALVRDAQVILLDEPTAFLDMGSRISVLSLLHELSREGRTVIFSSHDVRDALDHCDSVLALCPDARCIYESEDKLSAVRAAFPDVF